jgi:hypothetical protein
VPERPSERYADPSRVPRKVAAEMVTSMKTAKPSMVSDEAMARYGPWSAKFAHMVAESAKAITAASAARIDGVRVWRVDGKSEVVSMTTSAPTTSTISGPIAL